MDSRAGKEAQGGIEFVRRSREVNNMPLEKPAYRDNIERIKDVFPNKELLNLKEVAMFCGIDVKTARKLFDMKNNYISVAKLARELS